MPYVKKKYLTSNDIAREIGTSPRKVSCAIEKGKLPIGFVSIDEETGRRRTIIIPERWEAYKRGLDMGGQKE